MDSTGSELDSSLPQPENPCLIVEDSQPDSVALEDDPESSYRALLARRLSSLQPAARSPVLELISSPQGSRCSQTNSQSENSSQAELGAAVPCSSPLQESEVLNVCPPANRKKCSVEDGDMDAGADSTTNCIQTEEGTSQFGFLELSQSQDLQAGDLVPQSDGGHCTSFAEQNATLRSTQVQDHKAARSEVSSSSSSESLCQSGRQHTVQVLLHSQTIQTSEQNQEILSSQEDMFDPDKTGAAVDSTVSEPEQRSRPAPTPSHSLHLLHLSGHGTLVQESLSQSSNDYIAPSQDNFPPTPLIIPSSPTDLGNEDSAGEPMDTSLPAEEEKEEPMETDTFAKPRLSASTPLSQNASGLTQGRILSVPSQPEFSHDVFVSTPSLEAPQPSTPSPRATQSQCVESAQFLLPLQLSENTCSYQRNSEPVDDDSQATQIEEEDKPPGADTSDSVGYCRLAQNDAETSANVSENSANLVSCSDSTGSICVQETPPHASHRTLYQVGDPRNSRPAGTPSHHPENRTDGEGVATENAARGIGGALALSESQPEEKSEDRGRDGIVVAADGPKDANATSRPHEEKASTNGHEAQADVHADPPRSSQAEKGNLEPERHKDKSLSDSSGEISFHFTLPKDGELIGPTAGATPPLISQLKQTLRHSTPIEIAKPDVATDADVALATGDCGEDLSETGDGKLSLRMKLVTPVEDGGSERFSLQKPTLSEEEASVVKVTTVSMAATSSPSVFTRVRQVHRQQEMEDDCQLGNDITPVRGELFASPQRCSQASSMGCNSLPNSQSEEPKDPPAPVEASGDRPTDPEASLSNSTSTRQNATKRKDYSSRSIQTPKKMWQQNVSQQTSFDAPGPRSPPGRGEPDSPSFRKTTAPTHRRHVRTIQEVRTTITRVITDVYYEDGKEVDRKVTQESEEPVVECQVLDSDISPCRTGSSSITSGDLADISSLSSKASSVQHSSGGTSSSTGNTRPEFLIPPSRGFVPKSPRRGGGRQQRGQRAKRSGSGVTTGRGGSTSGSRAFVPLTPRGRARRGRPPSRSSLSRGGGAGMQQIFGVHVPPQFSSEDEAFAPMLPPELPVSPAEPEPTSQSDSLGSSPDEGCSTGSSFVGLRVVAKWSSNGYFYSGRIIKDGGEGRFRLRFDDGYECEVAGRDILLCDPIPMETEVTALLEDQYFSIGVVKGHKSEGQELFYNVEKDGQRQWYNRTGIILSLEQGNKLREQHSLGPYEPATPFTKASDISLDNLVEGKRKRRGAPSAQVPTTSPRSPSNFSKRKLMSGDEKRAPSKRGKRGGGARAAQLFGVCNTSDSGTDQPGPSCEVEETQGPPPTNASLFMGFAFMLTASSESDRLTNKIVEDEDYVQTGPFNKAYTESQLQAGGGFILPDFNEEQCKAAYQSLLIADQHCRTRKYMLCLASGVPCVSHIWVRDCCKENKLLNYRNYLLPAGVGPDDAVVEWHPRSSPFNSLHILLVFENPVELWAQLASMGGASSVRHFQPEQDGSDIPAGKYDVALTDAACPAEVEKTLTSQDVPLVSPEWLIQSLICGERLGFHSRPQYFHHFTV